MVLQSQDVSKRRVRTTGLRKVQGWDQRESSIQRPRPHGRLQVACVQPAKLCSRLCLFKMPPFSSQCGSLRAGGRGTRSPHFIPGLSQQLSIGLHPKAFLAFHCIPRGFTMLWGFYSQTFFSPVPCCNGQLSMSSSCFLQTVRPISTSIKYVQLNNCREEIVETIMKYFVIMSKQRKIEKGTKDVNIHMQ